MSWVDWVRANWLPLVIGIGVGAALGAVIKALVDPPPPEYLIPKQYEELATEYIHKWERAGVPQKTIELALKWAKDWSTNLAHKLLPNNPQLAEQFAQALYPEALSFAEKYIGAVTGINIPSTQTATGGGG